VTHAPQVAALGDNHYCVVKHRDHTDVHDLDIEHRIDELARMLAGSDITDKTREYAAALLEGASEAEPRMQYL
jgi:DNA repair protein RecN (Recombination protein N)